MAWLPNSDFTLMTRRRIISSREPTPKPHCRDVLLALQRGLKSVNYLLQLFSENIFQQPILISAFWDKLKYLASVSHIPWVQSSGGSCLCSLTPPLPLLTHSDADRCLQSHDFANLALGVNNVFVKSFAPWPLSLSPRRFQWKLLCVYQILLWLSVLSSEGSETTAWRQRNLASIEWLFSYCLGIGSFQPWR